MTLTDAENPEHLEALLGEYQDVRRGWHPDYKSWYEPFLVARLAETIALAASPWQTIAPAILLAAPDACRRIFHAVAFFIGGSTFIAGERLSRVTGAP